MSDLELGIKPHESAEPFIKSAETTGAGMSTKVPNLTGEMRMCVRGSVNLADVTVDEAVMLLQGKISGCPADATAKGYKVLGR